MPAEGTLTFAHFAFLKNAAMPFGFCAVISLARSVVAGKRDFAMSMCRGQWSLAAKVWS